MNFYRMLDGHMRPKYRSQSLGRMSYERTAHHVMALRLRGREGGRRQPLTSVKGTAEVRGRAVGLHVGYPPAPKDQPYSEHLRLHPSENEGDVTTLCSWTSLTVSLCCWTQVEAAYWQRKPMKPINSPGHEPISASATWLFRVVLRACFCDNNYSYRVQYFR